jgi:1-acyl-sn-glycerol-3-phosphate acyltransferase
MSPGSETPQPPGPADRVAGDFWWSLGVDTVGSIFHWFFRLRLIGRDNIPTGGPAMLAANHVSILDPIPIALGPSSLGRTVRFLAAAEAFRWPLVGWGLRRIRQIPIRRGARDVGALDRAAVVIRRGALAGIFPEGRVSDDGRLQPLRRGAARIALAARVPIVPVAVWGTQVRWPRGGPTLRPPPRPRVAVVFGPALSPDGHPRDGAAIRDLTDRIMRGIQELLPLARGAGDS